MRTKIKLLCVLASMLFNNSMLAMSGVSIYNVIDYGAKGDGITDDAVAVQKAIDACTSAGGGQVLFPSGHTFMTGPVELKSNIDYHLAVNAT